jgi:hypothetical protein
MNSLNVHVEKMLSDNLNRNIPNSALHRYMKETYLHSAKSHQLNDFDSSTLGSDSKLRTLKLPKFNDKGSSFGNLKSIENKDYTNGYFLDTRNSQTSIDTDKKIIVSLIIHRIERKYKQRQYFGPRDYRNSLSILSIDGRVKSEDTVR